MSLADPLPASDFMDLLQIEDVNFVQQYNQQRSVPGGGNTRYADRSVSLWKAEITTIPFNHATAEGIMARINSRGGGLKTALLYNTKLPFPSTDPEGALLAAASPAIRTKADQLHISFEGMPADLVLPFGTWFGAIYNVSHYYLGQLVETATADGSGDTGTIEIWPPLPASVLTTDTISFSMPVGRFSIIPGTAYLSTVGALNTKIKFSAEQTYR